MSETRLKSEVATGYTRFQDGDVLVPKITPTFEASRSVRVSNLLNRAGAGTTELHILRAGPDIDSRYLLYNMHSYAFLKAGEAEMYGVAGQKRVPDDFLRNLSVVLPTLDEQRRIADFLDAETARIDQLALLRNRQLTTIEERYQTAISERVTPGISRYSHRSSVWPWLPGSLQTARLGYFARIQTGVTVDASRELPEDATEAPYLRVANVQGENINLSDIKYIRIPKSAASRSTLTPGDVVMTEANGNPDNLGRGAVWQGEIPGMVHQNHIFAIRTDKERLAPEFLSSVLASVHGRKYFRFTSNQVGIATTSSSKVLAMPIPVVDIAHQRRIATDCARMREASGRALSTLNNQLSLLTERRQSLITAAVTGQIDVTTAGRAAVG